MPGLTVDTSPTPSSQSPAQVQPQPYNTTTLSALNSQETADSQTFPSSSASPVEAPPYSPITPTLSAARLASSSASQTSHDIPPEPRYTYSHSQPAQTGIPAPAPIPVKFEDNVDAVALKSAISILQIQKKRAERDVLVLKRLKERAMGEPVEFLGALGRGEVKSVDGGGMFEEEDDDEGDEEGEGMQWDREMSGDQDRGPDGGQQGLDENSQRHKIHTQKQRQKVNEKWERLPTPQNVVRCPPINWNQYAVVGESLDKLHRDQVSRPGEGMPQRIGAEGQYIFGGEGQRRTSDLGGAVAAPFMPGRDRIDKPGPRKSTKKARTD